MRDRLIALLEEADREFYERVTFGCLEERLKAVSDVMEIKADYLLANGVVVLPCKLTETVYLSLSETQKVIVGVVTDFRITEFSKYVIVYLTDDKRYTKIPFTAFGKTVFLTKEEAEQALKGDVQE